MAHKCAYDEFMLTNRVKKVGRSPEEVKGYGVWGLG
jgi:hypothetical protein